MAIITWSSGGFGSGTYRRMYLDGVYWGTSQIPDTPENRANEETHFRANYPQHKTRQQVTTEEYEEAKRKKQAELDEEHKRNEAYREEQRFLKGNFMGRSAQERLGIIAPTKQVIGIENAKVAENNIRKRTEPLQLKPGDVGYHATPDNPAGLGYTTISQDDTSFTYIKNTPGMYGLKSRTPEPKISTSGLTFPHQLSYDPLASGKTEIKEQKPYTPTFMDKVSQAEYDISYGIKSRIPHSIYDPAMDIDAKITQQLDKISSDNPIFPLVVAKHGYEFGKGLVFGLIDKPITGAVSLGIGVVAGGLTKLPVINTPIGKKAGAIMAGSKAQKLYKDIAPTYLKKAVDVVTPQLTVMNIAGGTMTAAYAVDVSTRMATTSNKAKLAGQIVSTELAPMMVGFKIGAKPLPSITSKNYLKQNIPISASVGKINPPDISASISISSLKSSIPSQYQAALDRGAAPFAERGVMGLQFGSKGYRPTSAPKPRYGLLDEPGIKKFLKSEEAVMYTPTFQLMTKIAPQKKLHVLTKTHEPVVLPSLKTLTVKDVKVSTKFKAVPIINLLTSTETRTATQTDTKTMVKTDTKTDTRTTIKTKTATKPVTKTSTKLTTKSLTATQIDTKLKIQPLTEPKINIKTSTLTRSKTKQKSSTNTKISEIPKIKIPKIPKLKGMSGEIKQTNETDITKATKFKNPFITLKDL